MSPRRRIPGAERIVVGTLGDSITEGSPGYDSREGGDETSQWQHWAALADPRLEFRNCGRHGERTDEIMVRLAECAHDADVLVVQGGINDIAQGRPVEPAAGNLRAMVRQGKELGKVVLLADVLPWNNGWPDAEPKIRKLNELLRLVGSEEGVPVLPVSRHARGSGSSGPDACGLDLRRRPPLRRRLPPSRRARL